MRFFAASCGSNPVDVRPGVTQCVHADADGVVLEQSGAVLVSQWLGGINGMLSVSQGDTLRGIDVRFLAPDSTELVLTCAEYELRTDVENNAFATATPSTATKWQIEVVGAQAGSTSVQVRYLARGPRRLLVAGAAAEGDTLRRVGFTGASIVVALGLVSCGKDESPMQPIPTPNPGVMPQAVQVLDGGTMAATWNYEPNRGPNRATGPIVVDQGLTLAGLIVEFLGDFKQVGFNNLRDTLDVSGPDYALNCVIADTTIAQAMPGASPFSIDIEGRAAGQTTMTLRLMYQGALQYESGPLDIIVYGGTPVEPNAHFILKKNGIWTVIVDQGAMVDTTCNNILANPGQLEAEADELTDLYFFRFINDMCRQEDPPPGSNLVFRFADRGIARVINHPVHWGETEEFHILGESPGQTTVRVLLITNGQVRAITAHRSPWRSRRHHEIRQDSRTHGPRARRHRRAEHAGACPFSCNDGWHRGRLAHTATVWRSRRCVSRSCARGSKRTLTDRSS